MKELQAELRAKQASIEEMSGSAKNARFKALEVRCRLSEQELSRQKEIARSWEEDRKIDMDALEEAHAAQLKQKQLQLQALSDDRATLKQQTAALDAELGRWMDENDQLRAMVVKLEHRLQSQPLREAKEAKENIEKKGRELKEAKVSPNPNPNPNPDPNPNPNPDQDQAEKAKAEKTTAESRMKLLGEENEKHKQIRDLEVKKIKKEAKKEREEKEAAFEKLTLLQAEQR